MHMVTNKLLESVFENIFQNIQVFSFFHADENSYVMIVSSNEHIVPYYNGLWAF